MLNFSLGAFWSALEVLDHEVQLARAGCHPHPNQNRPVPEAHRARLQNNMSVVFRECAALRLERPEHVALQLEGMFRRHYSYDELERALEAFQNALVADAKEEMFFHYTRENAQRLGGIDYEWKSVFAAFPSTAVEVRSGIDCFALGNNVGCVFHMSRVGEIGLRSIARACGVNSLRKGRPLEWGTWGDVFAAIDVAQKPLRNKPAGPKKDAALSFYDTVLSDLHAIQSLYRDRTMHFRAKYDPGEAQSAVFRAKSLMETLATKLNEASPRQIKWGF